MRKKLLVVILATMGLATSAVALTHDKADAEVQVSVATNTDAEKEDGVYLQDGYLYLYKDNAVVSKEGYYEYDEDTDVYVSEDGYVEGEIITKDDLYYYYIYNNSTGEFEVCEKSEDYWVLDHNNDMIHMTKNGVSDKFYDAKAGTLKKYADNKWSLFCNDISVLEDGKIYYFDKTGVIGAKKGFYYKGNDVHYEVGLAGNVIGKLYKDTDGFWKYGKYNEKNSLILQKKVWVTPYSNQFYIGAKGYASRIFYGSTQKCKDYNETTKTWVYKKSQLVGLADGNFYYFNRYRVRYSGKGWIGISKTTYYNFLNDGIYNGKLVSMSYYRYAYYNNKNVRQYSKWVVFNKNQFYINASGYSTVKYYGGTGTTYLLNTSKMKWSTKIVENYLTNNPCYKAGRTITVKGLMLHSVGCPQQSALGFLRDWNKTSYGRACVHGFIDGNSGVVYQTLPWNRRGWHCASGVNGSGNNFMIGVEMCEPSCISYTTGSNFTCSNYSKARTVATRTYNSAVQLYAYLCLVYDLNPTEDGVILSHREGYTRGIASGHGDPDHLWKGLKMAYSMNTFRSDVNKSLKKMK